MFKVYEVRERPLRDTLVSNRLFPTPQEAMTFVEDLRDGSEILDYEIGESSADFAIGCRGQLILYRVEAA